MVAAAAHAADQPPLGRLVDAGGYRAHIYCTGEGNPTVVVASGGFSFDWGLIQPRISQTTRICTYDTAGSAWSDPFPEHRTETCSERVRELHNLLKNAGVSGPYVLVGFSLGGLVARLYNVRYPAEVAGLVFVDHAFIDTGNDLPMAAAQHAKPMAGVDSPPVLISETPIALDLEDDVNFKKLPEPDQALHRWALAIHSVRPTGDDAAECFSEVGTDERAHAAGDKPVVVVSTLNGSPRYRELQKKLLALSDNSKQVVAENSSHMVIIDQPEIVVRAIEDVVRGVRRLSSR